MFVITGICVTAVVSDSCIEGESMRTGPVGNVVCSLHI